jgi:hypothetical protein
VGAKERFLGFALEYYAYALGADPKSVISGKFDETGIAYAKWTGKRLDAKKTDRSVAVISRYLWDVLPCGTSHPLSCAAKTRLNPLHSTKGQRSRPFESLYFFFRNSTRKIEIPTLCR